LIVQAKSSTKSVGGSRKVLGVATALVILNPYYGNG